MVAATVIWSRKGREQKQDDKAAVETAWKIHGALVDWTGKVDAKAAFAFALESAGLTFAVNLKGTGRLFSTLDGPLQNITYYGAVILMVVAAACAMWVVIPRLRMWHVKKEWQTNFVYFGHLKFWQPADLPDAIRNADLMTVLTQQMVKMSEIAWKKHLMVKTSMILASFGGLALIGCSMLVHSGTTP